MKENPYALYKNFEIFPKYMKSLFQSGFFKAQTAYYP